MGEPTIQGVVAVLTDEQGRVAATAADFEHQGYGGFSLQEAQTVRVEDRVAIAFIRAYASECILKVTSSYDAKRMVDNLCRDHGWRLTIMPIGHDAEDADNG
jgi:hypothetical protein